MSHFLRERLIEWDGMERMKPVIRTVLEPMRAGEMTLDQIQSSIDRVAITWSEENFSTHSSRVANRALLSW